MKEQVLLVPQILFLKKVGLTIAKAGLSWKNIKGEDGKDNYCLVLEPYDIEQNKGEDVLPAPTFMDLLLLLPRFIKEYEIILEVSEGELSYIHEYYNSDTHYVEKDELVSFSGDLMECAYNMLYWLTENKYINHG
jgi:hypothetical protein